MTAKTAAKLGACLCFPFFDANRKAMTVVALRTGGVSLLRLSAETGQAPQEERQEFPKYETPLKGGTVFTFLLGVGADQQTRRRNC